MGTLRTSFTLPVGQDRAVIAIQDTIDRLQWRVLESTTSRFVIQGPPLHAMHSYNFPKLSIETKAAGASTDVLVSISLVPAVGSKKYLSGVMGQFVNSVSLRIQTNSVAINPTVAIGEGQGDSASIPTDAGARLSMLERLVNLHERGVLTDEEFMKEKTRILKS